MNAPAIPTIFSPRRRAMRQARAANRAGRPDAARFLADDMIEDTLERLAFLMNRPNPQEIVATCRDVRAANRQLFNTVI